jgi:hypothetical protein
MFLRNGLHGVISQKIVHSSVKEIPGPPYRKKEIGI